MILSVSINIVSWVAGLACGLWNKPLLPGVAGAGLGLWAMGWGEARIWGEAGSWGDGVISMSLELLKLPL